jgi:hypothetical protein
MKAIRNITAAVVATLSVGVGAYALAPTSSATVGSTTYASSVNRVDAAFSGAGIQPNTRYSVTFEASRYDGDPFPYTAGEGATSNAGSWVRASYALSDLSAGTNYGGAEGGPVYEVRSCLNELPSLNVIACSSSYVGFIPEGQWTYHG